MDGRAGAYGHPCMAASIDRPTDFHLTLFFLFFLFLLPCNQLEWIDEMKRLLTYVQK